MRETREAKVIEVRDVNGVHEADIRIVTYGVVDNYNTSWAPGVFADSIREGSIPAVWSHREDDPIGVVKNFRDCSMHLEGTLEFLDFEAVPKAKMAYEALKKKAIRGISFRFERGSDEPDPEHRGATRINSAAMIEVSPVLRPAVPGSKILAVRAGDETISRKVAADIIMKFSLGDFDLAEALTELKNTGSTGEGAPPPNVSEIETQPGSKDDKPEEVVVPQPDPDEADILEKLMELSRADKK